MIIQGMLDTGLFLRESAVSHSSYKGYRLRVCFRLICCKRMNPKVLEHTGLFSALSLCSRPRPLLMSSQFSTQNAPISHVPWITIRCQVFYYERQQTLCRAPPADH